jgi:hypothetical protein
LWQKPKLPHQTQSVGDSPVLDDLAVLKSADINDGDNKATCMVAMPSSGSLAS